MACLKTFATLFIALGGVFVARGVLPALAAQPKWGAIALDVAKITPSSRHGIGNGDTEDEAKANAQKACTESGVKTCKVVATYQVCGSIAAKPSGGGGWGTGATKASAESGAMQSCADSSCKVVVTGCN